MSTNDPQPLYKLTGTTPEMIRQPDGSYEPGYRVSFTTAAGQQSYVVIPRSDELEDVAHAAVEAEAHRLVKMHRRQPPMHQGG